MRKLNIRIPIRSLIFAYIYFLNLNLFPYEDHPKYSDYLQHRSLSQSAFKSRDFKKAISEAAICLKISNEIESFEEGALTLTSYLELGMAFEENNQLANAIDNYRKGLKILRGNNDFGENAPYAAGLLRRIGHSYFLLGEYDLALQHHHDALLIQEKHTSIGLKHQDTGRTYNSLGLVLRMAGKPDLALSCFNKSLVILEKAPTNEKDPLELSTLHNNIGLALDAKGEYEKAVVNLEKAIRILEGHPQFSLEGQRVAAYYSNTGITLGKMKEYTRAMGYLQKAVDLQTKHRDNDQGALATTYNNIGQVFQFQGDMVAAIEHYEKAITIMIRILGDKHPDVATIYVNLGNAWKAKENSKKAQEYYSKAELIRKSKRPVLQLKRSHGCERK